MMFKTHIVIAVIIAMLFFPLFGLNQALLLVVFLFATALPDIDASTSFIGKRIKVVGWLFRHRGIFHTFTLAIIFSTIIWLVSFNFRLAIVFCMGYILHLLIDMLNYEGIMPIYPFSKWRIKGFMKSNSAVESVVFIGLLILGFVLFFRR